MIKVISSWASQIIIAVMISVIFEMILPDSNNKKYVKMVIGLYILFTIVSPIISNSSTDFFQDINIIDDIEVKENTPKANLSGTSLKEAYILSLKQDIHEKLKNKGYVVSIIKVDADVTKENYGSIKGLEIGVCKDINKEKAENKVGIDKISIGNEKQTIQNESKLTNEEKEELKEFISSEYGVDITNVILT